MPYDKLASRACKKDSTRADFWNPPAVSFADRMEQSNLCTFDLSQTEIEEQSDILEAGQPLQQGKPWRETWEEAMDSLGQETEPTPVVFQTVPICYDRELVCSRQGSQVGFVLGQKNANFICTLLSVCTFDAHPPV